MGSKYNHSDNKPRRGAVVVKAPVCEADVKARSVGRSQSM
jgi:hypothetical protein